MLQALNEMKTGKATEPSEVSLQLIAASGGVGIQEMAEICRRVPDGFGMPTELALHSSSAFTFEDARRVSCQRKKVIYVFCGPRECFLQSTKEYVEMGNGEERNKRRFG